MDKSITTRKDKDKKKPPSRTNHLLIIGINQYANGIAPLYNAVRDAENFKEVLLKTYQFEEKNVQTLFNKEATRKNIISAFSNLLNKLTDQDNLIFYYSGHGEVLQSGRRKRGYWIPADAVLNDKSTYITNNTITQLFSDAYAHHIFGIVDSCFSGSLFRDRKLSTIEERLESAPSRWLLTAGRLEPVSDGSLGENSPFATALLTHLQTTNTPSLWASDLCNRVLNAVSFNTDKQTPRGEPLPNVGHQGGQFVFYKKGYVPTINPQKATNPNTVDKGVNKSPVNTPNDILKKEPTTLSELKTYLKKEIVEDLETAITEINHYLQPTSTKVNDMVLQASRYNSTKKSEQRGIITFDQANRTYNQIKYALIDYIDDLEGEEVTL